jgi:hypothetical protein
MTDALQRKGAAFAYSPTLAARDPHGYVLGFGEAVQG